MLAGASVVTGIDTISHSFPGSLSLSSTIPADLLPPAMCVKRLPSRYCTQALVPPPLDPQEAPDDKRELLDTRFKFLNPVDDLKHLSVEAVYLHIRLGLQHYVPEAFGTQPMAPAPKGEGEEPDHDAAQPHFFEFDVLLADRAVAKITVSLLPIVMVTVTFFMIANLHVVSRWRRFVRRTADPVNPHYPHV